MQKCQKTLKINLKIKTKKNVRHLENRKLSLETPNVSLTPFENKVVIEVVHPLNVTKGQEVRSSLVEFYFQRDKLDVSAGKTKRNL